MPRAPRRPLRFTVAVVPADGRVMARLADAGEIVQAGQPELSVSGESRGWPLRLEVADRDALRIALGATAALCFAALPGETIAAQVRRVGGAAGLDDGQAMRIVISSTLLARVVTPVMYQLLLPRIAPREPAAALGLAER